MMMGMIVLMIVHRITKVKQELMQQVFIWELKGGDTEIRG